MYGYIYKVTDLTNNKIYIGQKKSSVFLEKKYLGSGLLIINAVKAHGKENFTVELVEECDTPEILAEREIYWIAFYNSTNSEIGYNLSDGGFVPRLSGEHNGFYGKHHTEETKAKFVNRNYRRGSEHPMYGKTHSDEAKKKISRKNSGRVQSKEAKQKRLNTLQEHGGVSWWVSDEWKENISKGKSGKSTKLRGYIHVTNDIENKMIPPQELEYYLNLGWRRGRKKFSEEAKKHISDGHKGQQAHNKNKVTINNGTTEKFVTESELDEYLKHGWVKGRIPYTEEAIENFKRGAANHKGLVGYIWITNGTDNKRVPQTEVQTYLDSGWERGYVRKEVK